MGGEKFQNAHRFYVQPKLGARLDFLAKKMREQYTRDVIYPDVKIMIDPVRERRPEDTIESLMS